MEYLTNIIEQKCGLPASVTFTNNSYSLISGRIKNGEYNLRLHHMFKDADKEIHEAILKYLFRKNRVASKLVREFINKNSGLISSDSKRNLDLNKLNPIGKTHNLKEIFDKLNSEYFNSQLNSPITFGLNNKKRRKRCISLGSYVKRHNLIRINPVLDEPFVPICVIERVVYHEMLHAKFAKENPENKRHHFREFRRQEACYLHFNRAKKWEEENIMKLLQVPSKSGNKKSLVSRLLRLF